MLSDALPIPSPSRDPSTHTGTAHDLPRTLASCPRSQPGCPSTPYTTLSGTPELTLSPLQV